MGIRIAKANEGCDRYMEECYRKSFAEIVPISIMQSLVRKSQVK